MFSLQRMTFAQARFARALNYRSRCKWVEFEQGPLKEWRLFGRHQQEHSSQLHGWIIEPRFWWLEGTPPWVVGQWIRQPLFESGSPHILHV